VSTTIGPVTMTRDRMAEIANRINDVDGIVGVLLGGSRARGDDTPESDVDLGLYYRGSLDLPALRVLAREVAGPTAALTEPGGWGPWVDGGGWLTIDGVAVDWIYRNLDRVVTAWESAKSGRYVFHTQVGHPLGFPDFAYVGELALGMLLADHHDQLSALQTTFADYPTALGVSLLNGLWEASFLIENARKAVGRRDTAYVAGCLFRVVGLCAHALHGHAGRWLINEKGAVASTGRLPGSPAGFTARAQGLLGGLGTSANELRAALDAAALLLRDVEHACGVVGQ